MNALPPVVRDLLAFQRKLQERFGRLVRHAAIMLWTDMTQLRDSCPDRKVPDHQCGETLQFELAGSPVFVVDTPEQILGLTGCLIGGGFEVAVLGEIGRGPLTVGPCPF